MNQGRFTIVNNKVSLLLSSENMFVSLIIQQARPVPEQEKENNRILRPGNDDDDDDDDG